MHTDRPASAQVLLAAPPRVHQFRMKAALARDPKTLFAEDLLPIEDKLALLSRPPPYREEALCVELRRQFAPRRLLSIRAARNYLFKTLDLDSAGAVTGLDGMVVDGFGRVSTSRAAEHATQHGMGLDSAFPWAALSSQAELSKSDLHCQFPQSIAARATRAAQWKSRPGNGKLHLDALVRPGARGLFARGACYAMLHHGEQMDVRAREWFYSVVNGLAAWHYSEPPGPAEVERTWRVARGQVGARLSLSAPASSSLCLSAFYLLCPPPAALSSAASSCPLRPSCS